MIDVGDAPAFQFYPSDWLTGTLTFSCAEDGAYLRCVMHQWATGSIPGDDLVALARVMRVTTAEAKKLWTVVGAKFERGDDGLWRNARVEEERRKQADYRQAKADAGRRGGLAKAKQTPSTASVLPVADAVAKEKQNVASRLQSSSSVEPSQNDGSPRATRGSALIVGPGEFDRLRKSHAFVGARLRVPHVLHREFVTKLGGESPETTLAAWYADLDAELESTKAPVLDVFDYLRPKFVVWAARASFDAEMAKWVKEGA